MKKYIVIGNPINHSLSPKIHNYWYKKTNIIASYEKRLLSKKDLPNIISELKKEKIQGVNVTVPFKRDIVNLVDELSPEAKKTKTVNTLYYSDKTVVGHNTDIAGFELAMRYCKFDIQNKNVFILGAGGVVPSIIYALKNMNVGKITISNRTKEKANQLCATYNDIEVVDWGKQINFDMIINATSIGLNNYEKIKIDFERIEKGKFFYDVIYNPAETQFLREARSYGHSTENGKMMFIYQAHQAFSVWHKIFPKIDEETINLIG